MRRLPALLLAASSLPLCPAAIATVRPHHHTSSHAIVRRSTTTRTAHAGHITEHSSYAGISSERATEIQSALVQRGYLTGDPSGTWDSSSISAMQRFQSENGWQTKFVPDSRALIKLGLGAGSTPGASGVPATSSAATPIAAASIGQPF